ncbi:MAG: xanthine dehydrogenase family protein subunit M [Acidobacteriota bacterium]|nr:xanthine dehydrogenase family protein subunit M [Acidobacteriota bacterium]
MNPFEYTRARSAAGAVGSVSKDPGAAFLAGGTTLVDLMQLDVAAPRALVDVTGLPESSLGRIEPLPGGGMRVGALVKNSDLAADARIKARYPVLSEAILSGASPQIRNMATTAGNLLQRTRCPYFRDVASPCNKREPGSGCAAIGGYNRMHAILGTSEKCIATFPGDMPVALAALDAVVRTNRPRGGSRSIPLGEFYVSYGDDPARENVLEHGELVVAVDLPAAGWMARSHYLKIRDRASYEFALSSAAVALDIEGGKVRQARVALGGVATKPWRSAEAEKALTGAPASDASWQAAAEAALAGAKPRPDNQFKVELARRTVARALSTAAERRTA